LKHEKQARTCCFVTFELWTLTFNF